MKGPTGKNHVMSVDADTSISTSTGPKICKLCESGADSNDKGPGWFVCAESPLAPLLLRFQLLLKINNAESR